MHTTQQKRKLRTFLYIKEVIMLLLVVMSFILVGVGHFFTLTHQHRLMIDGYEVTVAIIFICEFIFEWYHAKNRRFYLKYHWFYLFAATPVPIESFELLRGIRALRLIKLAKAFSHLRYEHNTYLFERSPRIKGV